MKNLFWQNLKGVILRVSPDITDEKIKVLLSFYPGANIIKEQTANHVYQYKIEESIFEEILSKKIILRFNEESNKNINLINGDISIKDVMNIALTC